MCMYMYQATEKDRAWDDWKDTVEKGSGNKMGKRFQGLGQVSLRSRVVYDRRVYTYEYVCAAYLGMIVYVYVDII